MGGKGCTKLEEEIDHTATASDSESQGPGKLVLTLKDGRRLAIRAKVEE